MLNKHIVAIGLAISSGYNLAIASSVDRCASGRCIVHPAMGFDFFMDGMLAAQVKPGANTEYIQWRAQKRFAHAAALRGIVVAAPLAVGIAHGLIGFAAVGK